MTIEVRMPQLSDTMVSGKILAWCKKEGERVERGDVLAEIETDKANLQIESHHTGKLTKILYPIDSTVDVGKVLAFIGEIESEMEEDFKATLSAQTKKSDRRIKASPLARKLAKEMNIDLSTINGSGPDGRIISEDIKSLARTSKADSKETQKAPEEKEEAHEYFFTNRDYESGTTFHMSKMRKTIADRMQQSTSEAPHFFVTITIDMAEAVRLRKVLKGKAEYKGVSINHLIIKAAAYALKNEATVNMAVRDEVMVFKPDYINIGIITPIDDGLLVPVLKNVEELPLQEVVSRAQALTEKAKTGKLESEELMGGTFTISNMGMYDVDNFAAIINPGQGAVLAISSIKEKAQVVDNDIVPGLQMKATLSVDHRIIDGTTAGTFLRYFREALETPALLMV